MELLSIDDVDTVLVDRAGASRESDTPDDDSEQNEELLPVLALSSSDASLSSDFLANAGLLGVSMIYLDQVAGGGSENLNFKI